MSINFAVQGSGKPLLLIHGLGGSLQSWNPILGGLAAQREVIGIDLPGFGGSPALPGNVTMAMLADAVTDFIDRHGLRGVDAVGSSMGARLVLELARRGGIVGAVVSLNPGGFWHGWQRHALYASVSLSIRALRLLRGQLDLIANHALARTLMLPQFSARPWALDPAVVLDELRSYVACESLDRILHELAYGETQQGAPAGSIKRPLVIGWGRQDRVCFPSQARRAIELFPDARLHWFDQCGHFPHWDAPAEATRLILDGTAGITGSDRSAFKPRGAGLRPAGAV